MSSRTKYLSLLIVLAFTVGQVQYSYTSYFCTMLNAFVPSQSAALAIHSMQHEDGCTECDGTRVSEAGSQVLQPNCFVVNTLQKDVVSTFVGSQNPDLHAATAFAFIVPQPVLRQTGSFNRYFVRTPLSPPLDLPTLNNTLLI